MGSCNQPRQSMARRGNASQCPLGAHCTLYLQQLSGSILQLAASYCRNFCCCCCNFDLWPLIMQIVSIISIWGQHKVMLHFHFSHRYNIFLGISTTQNCPLNRTHFNWILMTWIILEILQFPIPFISLSNSIVIASCFLLTRGKYFVPHWSACNWQLLPVVFGPSK